MSEDIDEELPAKSVEELKNMLKNKGEGTIQAACYRKRSKNTSKSASVIRWCTGTHNILLCNSISHAELQHGNTIALQYSMDKSRWLDCGKRVCRGITCPRMFMSGLDWTKCWGEVYRIYRPLGRGPIRSGDFVGLYNTRSRRWFSMARNRGHTVVCPGTPTSSTGVCVCVCVCVCVYVCIH